MDEAGLFLWVALEPKLGAVGGKALLAGELLDVDGEVVLLRVPEGGWLEGLEGGLVHETEPGLSVKAIRPVLP